MKKLLTSLCACLLLVGLSGCSDASADISDGNKVLMKIGNSTVTKEDMYVSLTNYGSITPLINAVTEKIVEKEVPITDDMYDEAKEAIEATKKYFGEKWDEYLKDSLGYDSEEAYINERVIFTVRAERLSKKYIKENYKALDTKYRPMKVQILEAESKEKAEQALKAIKDGATFEDAIKSYGKDTTYKGSIELIHSDSTTPKVVFTTARSMDNGKLSAILEDANTNAYYIVKMIEADSTKFKEDAINSLAQINEIADEAFIHYLTKYDFKIYDVTFYNLLKEQKEEYLVNN